MILLPDKHSLGCEARYKEYVRGYNDALDEVARLNGVAVSVERVVSCLALLVEQCKSSGQHDELYDEATAILEHLTKEK